MANMISKIINTIYTNKYKFNKNAAGFSLLELIVGIIVALIVLGSLLTTYKEFMRLHNRQNRVMLIERSMSETSAALKDALANLPGRNIATSNGTNYAIPRLPIAGTIPDGIKNKPIELGIITPYKINGNDAFTVVYGDVNIPRLPIDPISAQQTQIGSLKVLRVPLPNSSSNFSSTNSPTNTNIKGEITPSPSPSPTKAPEPLLGDGNGNGNGNTTTGQLSPEMFNLGQLMLIVESPNTEHQASSLLGTLSSVSKVSVGLREFLEFRVEICQSGGCGQLTNNPLAIGISDGAILVPVKFMSFYLKKETFGNKVIRNDGGLILPNGSDSFTVVGGVETIVGESDSLKVDYHLSDNSIVTTPNNPTVPWLKSIKSVDVVVTGAMAGTQGSETFNRIAKLNFPVVANNIQ